MVSKSCVYVSAGTRPRPTNGQQGAEGPCPGASCVSPSRALGINHVTQAANRRAETGCLVTHDSLSGRWLLTVAARQGGWERGLPRGPRHLISWSLEEGHCTSSPGIAAICLGFSISTLLNVRRPAFSMGSTPGEGFPPGEQVGAWKGEVSVPKHLVG